MSKAKTTRSLYVKWSKRERYLVYGGTNKPDGGMLAHAFEGVLQMHGKALVDELAARGYDITTLRFSIALKARAEPVDG